MLPIHLFLFKQHFDKQHQADFVDNQAKAKPQP